MADIPSPAPDAVATAGLISIVGRISSNDLKRWLEELDRAANMLTGEQTKPLTKKERTLCALQLRILQTWLVQLLAERVTVDAARPEVR